MLWQASHRVRSKGGGEEENVKAVLLPAITMSAVASAAVAESGELTTGLRPPALTASQTDALGHALGGEAEPLPAADDGPVHLAAAQMDAITAGLVAVDVTAFAAAPQPRAT